MNNENEYRLIGDETGERRLLLAACLWVFAIFSVLYEPWLVWKEPHTWWLEWSMVWDAPYTLKHQDYIPYCPEGHACFFIVGFELVGLLLLYHFLKQRLGTEAIDSRDYSAYRRQRRERRAGR